MAIGKDQETILHIENVTFSRSRFKTYIGNIGEMIAEEVLEKEGYDLWMMGSYQVDESPEDEDYPGPLKSDRRKKRRGNLINALGLLYREQPRLPDEKSLREEYEARYKGSGLLTWKEFKSREEAEINMHKRLVKELKTFFGEKLENMRDYMRAIGPLRRHVFLRENPHIPLADALTQAYTIVGERGIWYTPDLIAKEDGEIFVTEVKANTGTNYLKGQRLEGLLLAKEYGFVPMLITANVSIVATHLVARKVE
jgi:hypothetical protein